MTSFFRRRLFFIPTYLVAFLFLILIVARLLLPYLVLRYVNRVLNRLPEYQGHVEDIDIALIRGAYSIDNLNFKKRDGKVLQPFVQIKTSDLSIEWRALFEGKLVGEIDFDKPIINLVNSESTSDGQLSTKGDWQSMVRDLFPIKFNHISIEDGLITYRHDGTKDDSSVKITNINGEIDGLGNRGAKGYLPANASLTGKIQDTANLKVTAKIDPLAKEPTFEGQFHSDEFELVKLNKLLRETIGIDAEGGTFQIFSEVSCNNGEFNGYVKPILKNVRIVSISGDGGNPLRLLWEGVVSLVTEIFTNLRHDQFAAKIPFEGKLGKTDIDFWTALETIARNAFVKALSAKVDDDISTTEQKSK